MSPCRGHNNAEDVKYGCNWHWWFKTQEEDDKEWCSTGIYWDDFHLMSGEVLWLTKTIQTNWY